MSAENDLTRKTYELKFENYLERTPGVLRGDIKVFIDGLLELLDHDADILELGSGTGRDADYMESQGFKVLRTDVVDSFIQYQKSQAKRIEKLDLLEFDLKAKFDLIFANAVFLHFPEAEFREMLTKLMLNLKPVGILAFTLKQGRGSEVTKDKMEAERFFQYWQHDKLLGVLKEIGFQIHQSGISADGNWLQIRVGL